MNASTPIPFLVLLAGLLGASTVGGQSAHAFGKSVPLLCGDDNSVAALPLWGAAPTMAWSCVPALRPTPTPLQFGRHTRAAMIGGAAMGFLGAVVGLGLCHFDDPCDHPTPFAIGGFVLGAAAGAAIAVKIANWNGHAVRVSLTPPLRRSLCPPGTGAQCGPSHQARPTIPSEDVTGEDVTGTGSIR